MCVRHQLIAVCETKDRYDERLAESSAVALERKVKPAHDHDAANPGFAHRGEDVRGAARAHALVVPVGGPQRAEHGIAAVQGLRDGAEVIGVACDDR
jgi:hypothetical protein